METLPPLLPLFTPLPLETLRHLAPYIINPGPVSPTPLLLESRPPFLPRDPPLDYLRPVGLVRPPSLSRPLGLVRPLYPEQNCGSSPPLPSPNITSSLDYPPCATPTPWTFNWTTPPYGFLTNLLSESSLSGGYKICLPRTGRRNLVGAELSLISVTTTFSTPSFVLF